jgi:hypothetical protein
MTHYVLFECGEWKGNPPKGTATPRKRVGRIYDENGDSWEVFYWKVKNKTSAAQFLVRENLSIARNIFFSSREEAIAWRNNPVLPTLAELKDVLRFCKWHEPSEGLTQVWLDFGILELE